MQLYLGVADHLETQMELEQVYQFGKVRNYSNNSLFVNWVIYPILGRSIFRVSINLRLDISDLHENSNSQRGFDHQLDFQKGIESPFGTGG